MPGKVITGDDGYVELQRTSLEYSLQTTLETSDVNTATTNTSESKEQFLQVANPCADHA